MNTEELRKLDAEVHIKVMGIRECAHVANKYGKCEKCGLNKSFWERVIPYYSTDIAAAWLVVEKLNYLSFSVHRENCSGIRYDANAYNLLNCSDEVRATEATAPLAICHAALAAVRATPAPAPSA